LTEYSAKKRLWARSLAIITGILLGTYLLLTSTLRLHDALWPYDVKRFLELSLLPAVFSVVLVNGPLRSAFQQLTERMPVVLKIALFLFLCLGVVSSAYNGRSAMSVLYSLADVALLYLLVLALLCVAACRQAGGRVFDQTAAVLLALVALAVGLQELAGVFAAWSAGREFNPDIALLHYSYPRFYNQVQTWSIPVIASLPLIFPGKPLARILCLAALVLEWYVVMATGARGTLAAVVMAVSAAALLLPEIRKPLVSYTLVGLLGGLLVYGMVLFGHQNLSQHDVAGTIAPGPQAQAVSPPGKPGAEAAGGRTVQNVGGNFAEPLTGERIWTFSGRLMLWRDALSDAGSHPLLGIGPMNYACTGPVYRSAHPHSFPLQIAAEWGTPALLLMLTVAAYCWIRLFLQLRKPEQPSGTDHRLAGILATALLAASFHACLSGVLVMPASQVAGVLVCGWLLGLMPAPASPGKNQMASTALLISGLAVSAVFLTFARHELAVSATRLEQTQILDRGIPRLWQNGKVCRLYREAAHRSDAAK